jgi:hypothetical protein
MMRSLRFPGQKLGLGTFVNSDIDANRKVIYFGIRAWTAATVKHNFTQGATRMATIETVLLTPAPFVALASASIQFKVGTIGGGTVMIRLIPAGAGLANTNNHTIAVHYWMIGTPDVNRLIV